MKPEELRSKSMQELKNFIQELKEEFFKLGLQKSVGQLEKNHRFKQVRRDIARAKTLLNENLRKASL